LLLILPVVSKVIRMVWSNNFVWYRSIPQSNQPDVDPTEGATAAYAVVVTAFAPPPRRLDVGGAVLSTSAALCTPPPTASPRSRLNVGGRALCKQLAEGERLEKGRCGGYTVWEGSTTAVYTVVWQKECDLMYKVKHSPVIGWLQIPNLRIYIETRLKCVFPSQS